MRKIEEYETRCKEWNYSRVVAIVIVVFTTIFITKKKKKKTNPPKIYLVYMKLPAKNCLNPRHCSPSWKSQLWCRS